MLEVSTSGFWLLCSHYFCIKRWCFADEAVEARRAVLFLLRTLRNVCAAGQAATELLVINGALMDASQLIRQLIHIGPSTTIVADISSPFMTSHFDEDAFVTDHV